MMSPNNDILLFYSLKGGAPKVLRAVWASNEGKFKCKEYQMSTKQCSLLSNTDVFCSHLKLLRKNLSGLYVNVSIIIERFFNLGEVKNSYQKVKN